MLSFLNEVQAEAKLSADIQQINDTVDIAEKQVAQQLEELEEAAEDFVDLNDTLDQEIAMARQMQSFGEQRQEEKGELVEPVPEALLGKESLEVVEWVKRQKRRKEKKARMARGEKLSVGNELSADELEDQIADIEKMQSATKIQAGKPSRPGSANTMQMIADQTKNKNIILGRIDHVVDFIHTFNEGMERHLNGRPFSAKDVRTLQNEEQMGTHMTKAEIKSSKNEDKHLDKMAR